MSRAASRAGSGTVTGVTSRLVLLVLVITGAGGCASIIGITDIVLVDRERDPDDDAGRSDAAPDGAASSEDCEDVCSVIPASCRAAPECSCILDNASCSNTFCGVDNGATTFTCGGTVCTFAEGSATTCVRGGASCACD